MQLISNLFYGAAVYAALALYVDELRASNVNERRVVGLYYTGRDKPDFYGLPELITTPSPKPKINSQQITYSDNPSPSSVSVLLLPTYLLRVMPTCRDRTGQGTVIGMAHWHHITSHHITSHHI